MKYKVTGGTHLGIKSCYGEKDFEATSTKDLFEQVVSDANKVTHRNDCSLENLKFYFDGQGYLIWYFHDEARDSTIFEFYFEFYYKELK